MRIDASLLEHYPWLLLILLPVLGAYGWLKYRTGSFRLSQSKSKKFYALLGNEPLRLQLAANSAFGYLIDDLVIALARERHNPLGMLRDYKQSRGLTRYGDENFVQIATGRPLNFKRRAEVCLVLMPILPAAPWLLFLILPKLLYVDPNFLIGLVLAGLGGSILSPLFAYLNTTNMAAHRLVHELDARYPLIRPLQKKAVESEFVDVPVMASPLDRPMNPKARKRSSDKKQTHSSAPD